MHQQCLRLLFSQCSSFCWKSLLSGRLELLMLISLLLQVIVFSFPWSLESLCWIWLVTFDIAVSGYLYLSRFGKFSVIISSTLFLSVKLYQYLISWKYPIDFISFLHFFYFLFLLWLCIFKQFAFKFIDLWVNQFCCNTIWWFLKFHSLCFSAPWFFWPSVSISISVKFVW